MDPFMVYYAPLHIAGAMARAVGPPWRQLHARQLPEDDRHTMQLTSASFENGQPIPRLHAYKGEGHNVPPNLAWADAPEATQSFAIIVEDPDAPRDEPWAHWVAYDISGGAGGLPTDHITQGTNDFGNKGYDGPMPPRGSGTHHYHFRIFALDTYFDLRPGVTRTQLLSKIEGHVLDSAELIGTYERPEKS
jgi:hypothetical protein